MVLYENTKQGFLRDVRTGHLSEILKSLFISNHIGHAEAETTSWKNSSAFVSNILKDPGFDDDITVYLEYQVFLTSKRVDLMLAGTDAQGRNNLMILELKQWTDCLRTARDGIVSAFTGSRRQEVTHPSYQAKSYVDMLRSYARAIDDNAIGIYSCAYLHNYVSENYAELTCTQYRELVEQSPVFIKGQEAQLKQYLQQYICHRQTLDILPLIETSELVPGKELQDAIVQMMQGTDVFTLVDEQKVVFEQVLESVQNSLDSGRKTVIICQGGPGTGKSVVALKLLCDLILQNKAARYVTHNSSLKNVYKEILAKAGKRKNSLEALFAGDGMFQSAKVADNAYDCILVDEAHRVTEHWSHSHDEQHIQSIIRAARVSVFFIDENQRVTVNDFGSIQEIRNSAAVYQAEIIEGADFNLISQFRCGGSDGFIGFLDYVLYEKEVDYSISPDYDIKVFQNPVKFRDALRARNDNNRARMVAGYCYEWVTGKEKARRIVGKQEHIPENQWATHPRMQYDIILDDFAAKWNLSTDRTWINSPNSFDEVGCIHTSQGLELEYCGVIIGKDLRYENGRIVTDQNEVAGSDDTSGIRTCKDKALAHQLILNTYRTMLTRGQRGCYIFCEDKALSQRFLEALGKTYADDDDSLTVSQRTGLEMLLSGKNCFVTGEGGTGKSYLISRFSDAVRSRKKLLRCAPTGIAAEHIHGRTIHSCFQPPRLPSIIAPDAAISDAVIRFISKQDIIIIDEISMCRIDLFAYVMRVISSAETLKGSKIQIVLCGDFFQLPPVVPAEEADILEQLYGTRDGFAFESDYWKANSFEMIDLKENIRQGQVASADSDAFTKYLNNVRVHRNVKETLAYLNSERCAQRISAENAIELHTTNEQIDRYNQEGLERLPGTPYEYKAIIEGDFPENRYPVQETIQLKPGAKVMFLRNDKNRQYQNGTMGVVKDCLDDGVIVTVGHNDVYVVPYVYTAVSEPTLDESTGQVEQKELKCSFTQLPLRLAYAITVHKSQGQTFDAVNFDPSGSDSEYLENGQLYVALSRVKTIGGLYCYHDILPSEWRTSEKVLAFYNPDSSQLSENNTETCQPVTKPETTSAAMNGALETVHEVSKEAAKHSCDDCPASAPIISDKTSVIGTRVRNLMYGEGTVSAIQGQYMTVIFSAGEKKFLYPDAFEKFLQII